jgi:integrase
MVEKLRLTKRVVDALTPGPAERIAFDRDLPGFGLKITPSGRKIFLFQYRFPPGRMGRTRRVTLGEYGQAITPDQARSTAMRLKGKVANNFDPFEEDRRAHQDAIKKHTEEKRATERTVAAISAFYIERHVKPRNRSWAEYERLLKRYILPEIGGLQIDRVRRADVVGLLDEIEAKRSSQTADAVLRVLRAMFNWHAVRDEDFVNPIIRGMTRSSARFTARDRILTDHELRAVWSVLLETPYPFGPLFRMLLLTGQRRDEVASMRWDDLQGDLWIIPKERYKSARENVTPLTPSVLSLLKEFPRTGPYVFTTTGSTPVSGFSKAKRALDERSGTANWRLHDLRRTARSLMSRAGISRDIAERVLGHAVAGIVGVYDRHDYLAEKRNVLRKLESLVHEIARQAPNKCGAVANVR